MRAIAARVNQHKDSRAAANLNTRTNKNDGEIQGIIDTRPLAAIQGLLQKKINSTVNSYSQSSSETTTRNSPFRVGLVSNFSYAPVNRSNFKPYHHHSAGSSEDVLQRDAKVKPVNKEAKGGKYVEEGKAADDIKGSTDKAVGAIATAPVADPGEAGWLGRFEKLLKAGGGSTWAATLGYAVETIATPLSEGHSFGDGKLLSQQTRGNTRPDFVLSGKADLGWYDITSDEGHVLKKAGNWGTRSDFPTYEIVYDQIDAGTISKARQTSGGDNKGILGFLGEAQKKKEELLADVHKHLSKYPKLTDPSDNLENKGNKSKMLQESGIELVKALLVRYSKSITSIKFSPTAMYAILSWLRGNTSWMYQYGFTESKGVGIAHGALLINLLEDLEPAPLSANGIEITLKED